MVKNENKNNFDLLFTDFYDILSLWDEPQSSKINLPPAKLPDNIEWTDVLVKNLHLKKFFKSTLMIELKDLNNQIIRLMADLPTLLWNLCPFWWL